MSTDRSLRSRIWRWTRRVTLVLTALLLLGLAGSSTHHAVRQRREAVAFPPPGRLIDVGGHRLHLHCTGSGGPTVLLEAPTGGSSLGWSLVQPELVRHVRTCSYDRSGYAWSEPGPAPRTAERIVSELHTLLARADEPGPYLLVGSSMGGIYARLFAARHPRSVAGIVFVDSAHERQFEDNPIWNQEIESTRRVVLVARLLVPLGLLRLANLSLGEGSSSLLPMSLRPAARALGFRTSWVAALKGEMDGLDESLKQVADAIDSLPTPPIARLPIVVLTRDRPEGEEAREYPRWLAVQKKLLAFSSWGVQRVVPGAGHFIQADRPQAVVEAVRQVLERLREPQPH